MDVDDGICVFAAAAAAPLDERFMVGGATILGDVWRCCFCRRRSPLIDLRFTDKKGERGREEEATQAGRSKAAACAALEKVIN